MDTGKIEGPKGQARGWFETLRDHIIAAFEALEDALPATAPLAGRPAGRFAHTPWNRTDHTGTPGGGGVMAIMKGRVSKSSASTPRRCSASSAGIPQGHSGRGDDPRTSPPAFR